MPKRTKSPRTASAAACRPGGRRAGASTARCAPVPSRIARETGDAHLEMIADRARMVGGQRSTRCSPAAPPTSGRTTHSPVHRRSRPAERGDDREDLLAVDPPEHACLGRRAPADDLDHFQLDDLRRSGELEVLDGGPDEGARRHDLERRDRAPSARRRTAPRNGTTAPVRREAANERGRRWPRGRTT